MVSDTDPKSQALWVEIIRKMTPGERVNRALEITEVVRSLFRGNLRRQHPEWSEEEITKRMIEVYYGPELARAQAAK